MESKSGPRRPWSFGTIKGRDEESLRFCCQVLLINAAEQVDMMEVGRCVGRALVVSTLEVVVMTKNAAHRLQKTLNIHMNCTSMMIPTSFRDYGCRASWSFAMEMG
jgi:hypothetical protein